MRNGRYSTQGSPPWDKIEKEWKSRAGEPYDDAKLTNRYNLSVYPYTMPDLTIVSEECRYEFKPEMFAPGVDEPKKKIWIRQPAKAGTLKDDGSIKVNGEYVFGIAERRVVYNWAAVINAGPGSLVYVPEGAPKAKALSDRELLATSVITNHWTDVTAAQLTGFNVVILQDNDPSGEKTAGETSGVLSKYATSIRVVTAAQLWKHLPDPKKAAEEPPPTADIVNWLDEGGDPKKLAEICLEVPVEGITADPHDFPAECDTESYDWLLGKHLLRGEVAGTAAMGGTGKSNLAIVEALSMASGKQLLHDMVPERPLRVVLINLEDSRNTMNKRIAAVMRHYGLTKAEIGGRLFVMAKKEIKIMVAHQARGEVVRDESDIKRLIDFTIEKQADVLSIDSFIRTHGVNENDNNAVLQVVECFEEVAGEANCGVHLWHHTRKGNGDGATVESARGAQAFIDACRSVRILETMTKKERNDLLVAVPDMGQAGWYFREFNGKRNFAPPAEESKWFRYVSVEIDNARDFMTGGDQVGVVTPWNYPRLDLSAARTPVGRESALAAVGAGGPWRANSKSKTEPWVGVPIARALGLDLTDKRARSEVAKLVGEWLAAGLLRPAEGTDQKGNPREYIERA